MIIGLVIYGDLDTLSGGFLYDRRLVEHLRAGGHQVRIFSLPWRSYMAGLIDNLSPHFSAELSGANLDVLVQDELNHASLFFINRRLQGRAPYPLISLVHHLRCSEPRSPLPQLATRWIERYYLRSVDGFIFNSQTTRRSVGRLASRGENSVVAYPGRDHIHPDVSPDQIIQRASSSTSLRILFIGSLIPRKGLHVLLRALQAFDGRSWRLDIFGGLDLDRGYTATIRSAVRHSGHAERVHLHGPQPRSTLATYLRDGHVMALPSFYEGFGIAYLEAMGFGLPVIATTAGGPRELIDHGENGFLIPPGDHIALRGALERLSLDRARLAQMGRAAQARFNAHPTWAEEMAHIAEFLQNLV